MIEEIIKADDSFSESTFLSNVDHIFIMILNSIQNNNMEDVRHYLANDVYVKFNNMINEYKNKNIRRCFDEMNVKSSKIVGNMITDNFISFSQYGKIRKRKELYYQEFIFIVILLH